MKVGVLLGGLWLGWAALGCDDQVSPLYRGESLLTVAGSVEFTGKHAQGELVPALAFVSKDAGVVRILEVAVKGKFPSDFRLDVYDPPPQDVFTPVRDGSRIALGWITAVPVPHKSEIPIADEGSVDAPTCAGDSCDREVESTASWCTRNEPQQCYTEHRVCPHGDLNSPECKVTSQGDVTLKEPWRDFAGFSQNYMTAYLEHDAKAGSWLAEAFGSSHALARGYYLLELLPAPSREDYDARSGCFQQAIEMTAAKYNSEHGTQFTTDEVQGGCEYQLCAPTDTQCQSHEIGLCALPDSERAPIAAQLESMQAAAEVELGCLKLARSFALVEDPKHASISVMIGATEPPQLEREPEDADEQSMTSSASAPSP